MAGLWGHESDKKHSSVIHLCWQMFLVVSINCLLSMTGVSEKCNGNFGSYNRTRTVQAAERYGMV